MLKGILVKINSYIANNKIKNKIICELKKKSRKKFILLGTPLHGNLGDHAIVLKEMEFLNDNFAEIPIVEIPRYYFDLFYKKFADFINNDDIIIIPGGGFLGTIWFNEEQFVRRAIQLFDKNKIIIFPQTVTYSNDDFGKNQLKQSKEIYSKHQNLNIVARDKKSYKFLKENFCENNIFLTPDIVLYGNKINESENIVRTNKVIFCFRKDKETSITQNDIKNIEKSHFLKNFKICYMDTVLNRNVFPDKRRKEIADFLDNFYSAKLVITDRLHGMIFSAITGTPCIALGNSNGKVKAVYDWLKQIDYLKYVDNINDLENEFYALHIEKKYTYDFELLKDKFNDLYDLIRNK